MSYHGKKLQTYLCCRWANENNYYYDANCDAFIKVANGYEVAVPLADDDGDVLVTDYGVNGLKIEKRKSSMPNPYGKRKRCKTAEEAVTEFTSTHDNKLSRNCKADDTAALQEDFTEKDTPCNCIPHDEVDTSADNIMIQDIPVDCSDIPDYKYVGDYKLILREDGRNYRVRVGGDDAGVVDGVCQDYETARANFREKEKKCLKSCYFKRSCAFTLTTYTKQSFTDIQKGVQRLCKKEKGFLFSRYFNLKCACPFLEPNANGGWHVHMILCFYDSIPANLYESILVAWKKHIIIPEGSYKTDNNLVNMRCFYTFEEFQKHLEYLNPVSYKKKERLKFYPYKKKTRQFYGDLEAPKEIIMPAREAKKLTECERPALRHEIKILNASNTVFSEKEDLRLHNKTYYYTTNEVLWNTILDDKQSEKNDSCEYETVPPVTDPEPQSKQSHFSVTVILKNGEQFGKTMTEVDFNYDIEKAIELASFYERNSKLFGGIKVIRDNVPMSRA